MTPKKSLKKLGLLLTASLYMGIALAQEPQQSESYRASLLQDPNVKSVVMNTERLTPATIILKQDQKMAKAQAASALSNYLLVRNGIDNLLPAGETNLNRGVQVVTYQQYFKGIKVEHAQYKAMVKDGQVAFFNGAWFNVPSTLSLQPSLTEQDALTKAKMVVGAQKYAWEEVQERIANNRFNPTVVAALEKELADYLPKGELVIVKDFNKFGVAEVKLAYKFNIYASAPLSRAYIYIDAHTGKTLLVDKIIKHADNPNEPPASQNATVQTRYAGTQVIKTKQVSGNDPNSGFPLVSSHPTSEPTYLAGSPTYVLIDDSRGNGIETYDLNNAGGIPLSLGAFYAQGKSFTDADNNWTAAEHHRSPANDGAMEAENDDIAFDAHWGAGVVYDYWLQKHNRKSYDGNDATIKSFIHYGPAYDNAFWNGTAMTYGDGSGTAANGFKALTSLDVCAHEIGHGVCSFTSDLMYQGESGAMNEALSDIWAACIEHYSMVRSGSTVPATAYRPFYVGEQIGASYDAPLRRMDNPKKLSDPDTYGGQFWKDPNCSPNLANDQCGVHTNSGVLNHWFFLLTAGSKTGTRPAGMTANQYYFADSDDEINDKGNAYVVNGVGFNVSEQITFMMETMLSSSATYAEAREASIQAAIAYSGDPCGAIVESVTNAWYAVGVGEKFVKACTPTFGFISTAGSAVTEASSPAGCNAEKIIRIPVLLPANATATFTATGTATANVDYVVTTTTLSNSTAASAKLDVLVTIKNDAEVEADETIVLTANITNTGSSSVNKDFTITINDDDVVPVIGAAEKILLDEKFNGADGFADPQGWTEQLEIAETNGDPAATGKNQWGIFGNKLAITGKEGLTNTVLPAGNYNNLSESQTLIKSPLIDARGLGLLNIKFDYRVQGEVDVASGSTDIENLPVFDYMAVAYSLDGVKYIELNSGDFRQFAAATPVNGTFSANLPLSLANRQFYLAFRWSNDANAGGPESVSIDNLLVTGTTRKLENDLNHNGRENLSKGAEIYFYSQQDGQLLGKVKNGSTKDYGCTNLLVEKTGTGAFNLYQDGNGLYKVADKVVRIEPSVSVKASNTVTMYYTEAQLAGLEAASGHSRTEFGLFLVSDASYTLAQRRNTKFYPAQYTAMPGVGGYYSISFTEKVIGSYALGLNVSVPGVQAAMPAEDAPATVKVGNMYPNPTRGTTYVDILSPTATTYSIEMVNVLGQVVNRQVEKIQQGFNRVVLNSINLKQGMYRVKILNDKKETVSTQQLVKQ